MDESSVLAMFEKLGVLKQGHFVYTAGGHSDRYVDKNDLFPHVQAAEDVGRALAEVFQNHHIDVVVGPAVGAIALAHITALHLQELTGFSVDSVFAEQETVAIEVPGETRLCFAKTDRFIIGRGYGKFIHGRRALVIEDIINTGKSIKLTINATRRSGGVIVAAGSIWNRGDMTHETLGVPSLRSLVTKKLTVYDVPKGQRCPLCDAGVPIDTTIGHGKHFLEQQSAA